MTAIGFQHHDHSACIADGMAQLRAHCAAANVRVTPTRARVFEILLASHKALGAYDILDVLRSEGLGSQPPVVYRALEFLLEQGFAHRVERLNAFIACAHPSAPHSPSLLICRTCRKVAEADSDPAQSALGAAARAAGFTIEHSTSEAIGLCPDCADSERKAPLS